MFPWNSNLTSWDATPQALHVSLLSIAFVVCALLSEVSGSLTSVTVMAATAETERVRHGANCSLHAMLVSYTLANTVSEVNCH